MKNLLIICDNFPPQSGPRMGYLVKYAKRLGWNSYVVAAENKSRNDLTGLSGYAVETYVVPQRRHRKWNLLHILHFFWPYDYLRGEYEIRRIASEIVQRVKIDLVLCTHTYGWFPLSAAYAVAKKANIPLIVDIRDLVEQNPKIPFFEMSFNQKMDFLRDKCSFLSNRRAVRMHRDAAALTSISPWHAEWLKRWNRNSFCIYNGFDPELFKPIEPVKSNQFEIVYAGSLATKRQRNPELLLEAIVQLDRSGVISPEMFTLNFYGEPSGSHVLPAARALGIERYLKFFPSVPITNLPEIFAKASVLLLLGARPSDFRTHGVMTTKFYEYFASRRPILLVPDDEECLGQVIRESGAGWAVRTVEDTVSCLTTLLEQWKATGVVSGNTMDGDRYDLFSRETQASQFVEIFDKILNGTMVPGQIFNGTDKIEGD